MTIRPFAIVFAVAIAFAFAVSSAINGQDKHLAGADDHWWAWQPLSRPAVPDVTSEECRAKVGTEGSREYGSGAIGRSRFMHRLYEAAQDRLVGSAMSFIDTVEPTIRGEPVLRPRAA